MLLCPIQSNWTRICYACNGPLRQEKTRSSGAVWCRLALFGHGSFRNSILVLIIVILILISPPKAPRRYYTARVSADAIAIPSQVHTQNMIVCVGFIYCTISTVNWTSAVFHSGSQPAVNFISNQDAIFSVPFRPFRGQNWAYFAFRHTNFRPWTWSNTVHDRHRSHPVNLWSKWYSTMSKVHWNKPRTTQVRCQ